MPPLASYGLSILFGFIVWGIISWRYIWPRLCALPRAQALEPLLLLHGFRFIGLALLVPGVVSPDLPVAFAAPAAYGDFVAAILALLAVAALPHAPGFALAWVFNVWGTADLLYAFYQGNRAGLEPGQLGAAYFIVTILVPLLFITHGLVSRLLLGGDSDRHARGAARCPGSPKDHP